MSLFAEPFSAKASRVIGNHPWYDKKVLALAQNQGTSDPEQAMRSLCHSLIDEAGFTKPPFKSEILASFRDVISIERVPMREAGRLVPLETGFEIDVNEIHTLAKQNFTINHEVCHTFFSEVGSPQIKTDHETGNYNLKQEEEYLCDQGASNLLFDDRWFRPSVVESGITTDAILSLSNQFAASLEATTRAWCDLDLWPCAVVFWEKSVKPSEISLIDQGVFSTFEEVKANLFKLRVKLSWHSPSFREICFLPKYKSACENGLVYKCCETKDSTSGYEQVSPKIQPLWIQNIYVPYHKDGNLCPRVMTIITRHQSLKGIVIHIN